MVGFRPSFNTSETPLVEGKVGQASATISSSNTAAAGGGKESGSKRPVSEVLSCEAGQPNILSSFYNFLNCYALPILDLLMLSLFSCFVFFNQLRHYLS